MTQQTHTSHALRMSGFIHQTLQDRGIRFSLEDLRWALPQLEQAQFVVLEHAAQALARGHDEPVYMDLGAALRRLCDPALRLMLARAGIGLRVDVLFAMALQEDLRLTLLSALNDLRSADPAVLVPAQDKIRAWCGAAPRESAPVPAEVHAPAAAPAPSPVPGLPGAPVAPAVSAGMREPAPQPQTAPGAEEVIRRKAKVFGKAGALTLEIAPVRAQEHHASTARCTVMIEGALATGDGHYDWSVGSKVVFMCTQRELPQLLAVLMGWTSELEFKFHGANKKKSLHIAHQEHGLLVHVRETTNNVRVPVEDADCYALAMLVLAAMAHNEPHLDATAIMAVARAMAVAPAWRRTG